MEAGINPQRLILTDAVAAEVQAALQRMEDEKWPERIWDNDARLWSSEPEHVREISQRLGWLQLPVRVMSEVGALAEFGRSLRDDCDRVVLLGMGGSSLAPWSFADIFGAVTGYPVLTVLDSTAPTEVLAAPGDTPLERCCFIVSSKSGTTVETRSAFEYFWAEAVKGLGARAADHFVIITDPGTPLAELGHERNLRAVFLNWPDLGGRYSALSYFGLVPAAALGLPVQGMLELAREMAEACAAEVAAQHNPAAALGALLGVCHEMRRDKITFLTSPRLATFGDWAEQLLAESTGKEGRGLVPVVNEPLLDADSYGEDRVFVWIRHPDDETHMGLVEQLLEAGHPVGQIDVEDLESIGAEMFRWEFATAVAGAMMGINPFDQPNVQEAKDRTKQVLAEYSESGSLPGQEPDVADGTLGVFGSAANDVRSAVVELIDSITAGDYFAVMAYLPRSEVVDTAVAHMRAAVAERKEVATTFGYGPRFLHSTGQLHKGGPNTGVFLQITARDPVQVDIPGADYDFGTLLAAQAAGDFAALQARGRRLLRVDLGDDIVGNLDRLAQMVIEAASS